jgi:23S rRNA (uracil1939-C5)-methyltransferase
MTVHLHISEWDKNGCGLASYARPSDNKNVWVAVPQSIVGEVVEVTNVLKQSRGSIRYKAEISSLLQPSPCRVEPRCPYFSVCGGCVWQHIDYQTQLDVKKAWIDSLFFDLVETPECIQPILGCKDSYAYRNKMEFSFSQDKAGKRFLGLYGSRGRVVYLKECHLVRPWVSQALQEVFAWWEESSLEAYHFRNNRGTLQTLTIKDSRTTGDRMIMLTVSGVPEWAPKKSSLDSFVERMKSFFTPEEGDLSIVLRVRQIAVGRPTQMFDMILSGKDHVREKLSIEVGEKKLALDFHVGPESFFQPNTGQAQKIYTTALHMASIGEQDVVLDLYCGIGVFGMFAALLARKAIGIELSKDAAYDATINSQRLGLGNFSVHTGDVAAVLGTIQEKPDVVIVDPPRAGLLKAIDNILLLQPKRLVYVSCNPTTQASDAHILRQHGWRIQKIQPIDQFPHTTHVENCILFERG